MHARARVAVRFTRAVVMLLPLLAGFGLSSSALSSPSSQPPPPPGEVRVTAADDGRLVELSGGQVLVVNLGANPSTGFSWHVAEVAAGADGEAIVRQVGATEFEPASDLLGAPGTEILRFEAVAEGETTLRLVYRRPWQPGVEPARRFYLQVQALGPFTEAGATPTAQAGDELPESTTSSEYQPQLDLPSAFNWCDFGGCTPVRDQGLCGSCWAFSTVGPLEENMLIKGALLSDVSEQYLISCSTEFWGCNGGWWAHDYHAWKVPPGELGAGAVYESDFPYAATDSPCEPPHLHHHRIDEWHYVGSERSVPPTSAIKQAIYEHGPVAAAVCVNSAFQSYAGGIFLGPGCSPVNHAIVLVGWDDSQDIDGAWVLRNSWGAGWGEDGYMRIGYGVSQVGCGANYVLYSPSNCYSLTTAVSPAGAGTIAVDPPPNCESDGYGPGTVVEIRAIPGAGWHFTTWSGATSMDSHTVSVTMDSHKSVTAHFRPDLCIPWFMLPLGVAVCWIAIKRLS